MIDEKDIPRATGAGRTEDESTVMLIFGKKGSRKSTWAEEIAMRNKKRCILFDTLRKDFGNPDFCEKSKIKYDKVFSDFTEFMQAVAAADKDGKGQFRFVLRCEQEKQQAAFKLFFYNEERQRSALTDTTFLIDEIQTYTQPLDENLNNYLTLGRHSRNNLVAISRVVTEMPPLFRSSADIIISFQQKEERVVQWFRDFSPDNAAELRNLEKGDFRIFGCTAEDVKNFINKA
jgi:hypothetical protein